MEVLVTGGAGFIGGHLVEALVRKGHKVTVLDNLSSGNTANLRAVKDKIEFIQGDILNDADLAKACKRKQCIFHLAALPSAPRSVDEPVRSHEVNVLGTLKVLWAAKNNGVKRVIFSGSSAAYGHAPLPKKEDFCGVPLSPYGLQKLTAEKYCTLFATLYGLETITLRYFNVFGPRQNPDSDYAAVIPKFITLINAGKQPTIFGSPDISRDFTFVENVVQANILASEAKSIKGEVVNVACGQSTTLGELVKIISELVGKNITPKIGPARRGDIPHSLADVSRAKAVLGFTPSITLEDGLKRTLQWYRTQSA